MIKELKVGTYKLIDKEGWFSKLGINEEFYKKFFDEDCVTITSVNSGEGYNGDYCIIDTTDYNCFELVENYWNGESDLAVGMVVGEEGNFKVEFITEDYKVLLSDGQGFSTLRGMEEVKHFDQDKHKKREAFKKVVGQYKGLSLDNAYDTIKQHEDLLNIAWDVFRSQQL